MDSTEAFFNGQLSIDGDMEMAMKLKLIQPEEGLPQSSMTTSPSEKSLEKSLKESLEKSSEEKTSLEEKTDSIKVEGYKVSQVFENIQKLIQLNGKKLVEKVNGIYQFNINGPKGKQSWTVDLRNQPGMIKLGQISEKPNVILEATDDDFFAIMTGTLDATEAFFNGQLSVDGEMELAMKLNHLRTDQLVSKL